MERHKTLEMMRMLKLAGIRAAFDEVLATGLKGQHSLQQITGELLKAEIGGTRRAAGPSRRAEVVPVIVAAPRCNRPLRIRNIHPVNRADTDLRLEHQGP